MGAHDTVLKNCSGVPTWIASALSCPFIIGDKGPAGGKVFYLFDSTGESGLEAAPTDQSSGIAWECWGTVVGATGTAIGTGIDNTNAIISLCPTGNAASIAADYSVNGFSDWYLPSKDELELLKAQKTVVGGFADSGYWTSSDWASNYVHIIDFSDGSWDPIGGGQHPTTYYKAGILPIRAIRKFGR